MKKIRIAKVILYPIAAVLQILVVPSLLWAAVLAVGLLGLAWVNLFRLLDED